MPFVTEELWQDMPHEGKTIMLTDYPQADDQLADQDAEEAMGDLIDLIKAVRQIRNDAGAPMSKPVQMLIKVENDRLKNIFEENEDYIDRFCHPADLQIGKDIAEPKLAQSGILAGATVYIPMAELVDLDEEKAKLEKEIDKLQKEVDRSAKKLGNQKFIQNAPEAVVEKAKQKAADWQQKLDGAKDRLATLDSETK